MPLVSIHRRRALHLAAFLSTPLFLGACETTTEVFEEMKSDARQLFKSDKSHRNLEQRYIDFLLSGGGMAQINAEIASRNETPVETTLGFSGKLGTIDAENWQMPDDLGITKELNVLKDCLLLGWTGEQPDIDVVVSSSPAFGGSTLPNRMFINMGMLAIEGITGPQIAFVMAHELAHAILNHHQRSEFTDSQRRIAEKLWVAGIVASYAVETRARRVGDSISLEVKDKQAVKKGIERSDAYFGASQLLVKDIFGSAWNRSQEEQADIIGVDLIANSGVHYNIALTVLELEKEYLAKTKSEMEKFQAEAEASMREAIDAGDVGNVTDQAFSNLSKAAAAAVKDAVTQVSRSHQTPEKRIGFLTEYLDKFYIGKPWAQFSQGRKCETKRLESLLRSKQFQQSIDTMDAVVKMNQAVAIGNLDGVLPLESRVLNSNLQRHPTAAVAVFRSMRARGDVRRAVNVLENVDRRTGSPLSIYTTLAKEYLNQGNLNGTARLVTEGERWFEQTAFLPIRLQVAFWRQSPRHISKYRQECETSIGQIKNACREIVNYQAELRGEPKPYSSPFEKIRGYFPSS